MRRFEFVDSTSNKFWEVEVKGETLNVTFGEIGAKDFTTPEIAKAEMEKLIKEKTGKGYVEVGGKAVKAIKPAAAKKDTAGSMGEGLSKTEKKVEAKKVLAKFLGGQLELARGILKARQEEHWLFEELLKGWDIECGKPKPSTLIKSVFSKKESAKAELVMLEVLLHLPKELQKLQEELQIQIKEGMLSKYWKEVADNKFKGVKYSDPAKFTDQWYEERKAEIAKSEKEGEVRSKALNMAWREEQDLGQGLKLEMVLIPAGKFVMGSPESEEGRHKNETQHEVTLTKPFYMGKYEVTQEQWEAVMGNNPSRDKGPKLPVTNVSWKDCQKFIKKLNAKTDGGYRLPTEAEWEYACRAGTKTAFSFRDKITPKDANYNDSKIGKPVAVGRYNPNAFGLYDMHGNVWEWCEDWYGDYPAGSVTDPKGPATQEIPVLRGGSFICHGLIACSSFRRFLTPVDRLYDGGFRLARTADIKDADAVPTAPKSDPTAVLPATENLLVVPFTEAKAKEVQKEVAKSLKKEVEEEVDLGKGIKLDLVLIPAGKFVMGSPENEKQHEVTLTKSYYMGKYEVTQEQWEAVMGDNPSSKNIGAKLPVTDVSWEDCQEFIKKLNAKTDGGYRLPTEAEWEYACRAGTTTAFSFGDEITPHDANYADSWIGKPVAVGSYRPNAFGLYDMHGNVFEWCEDWYGDYPEGAVTDPKGLATGERRVLRGGSFVILVSQARSSDRHNLAPTYKNFYFGFRLVRTMDLCEDLDEDLDEDEDEDYDPLNLSEEEEKERASIIAEVEKRCRDRAKELGLPWVEEQELAEGLNLEMVLIPAGKFVMGSPESEENRSNDETQHEVTLTKSYYMGKYEVTQEQWEAVMGNNPSRGDIGPKLPVTDVSWEDCQEFIKKLNAKTNGVYRLPTEAEWEYACRAGTNTAYSYGDRITKNDANVIWGTSTKVVGSYKPNAFGLYDMHGNVWEWCEDWKADYPKESVIDPKGPAKVEYENRVLRGGSFGSNASIARSSYRFDLTPASRFNYLGFRLARTK